MGGVHGVKVGPVGDGGPALVDGAVAAVGLVFDAGAGLGGGVDGGGMGEADGGEDDGGGGNHGEMCMRMNDFSKASGVVSLVYHG